jgi:hypothetical protein
MLLERRTARLEGKRRYRISGKHGLGDPPVAERTLVLNRLSAGADGDDRERLVPCLRAARQADPQTTSGVYDLMKLFGSRSHPRGMRPVQGWRRSGPSRRHSALCVTQGIPRSRGAPPLRMRAEQP